MRPIGGLSSRFDFVDRLRFTIGKLIAFQKRIANLGPMYMNCNERQTSCTRRNRDERNGCPNCEFTIQHKIFQTELENGLESLPRMTRAASLEWPKEYLIQVANETASISASTKGIGRQWTIPTSLFVSIYRDEINKVKTVENYRLTSSVDAPASKNEPDEGDFD